MKKKRHEAIIRIIEANSISTQTELLNMLNDEGYNTTQATISRDIKDLRLVKKSDQLGRSAYAVDQSDSAEINGKYNSVFAHSVISADFAGNITVIKCYQGMANAACAALDTMGLEGIVGTLAGDDTFFVLCRSAEIAENMKSIVNNMIAE